MCSFERNKKNSFSRSIHGILFLSLAAAGFVIIRVIYRGSLRYAFLIWNLILAWVPFYLAMIITKHKFKTRIFKFLCGFFWLMFYPNAPYMITDFIHLSAYDFYESDHFAFNSSFNIWYDFFLISIFVVIGLILAYISLQLMQRLVHKHYGSSAAWGCICIVSLLSGYAIYLGRFIRVNSWEVVSNPVSLIRVLIENVGVKGIAFSVLFGTLVFFIYTSFHFLWKIDMNLTKGN